MTVTDMHPRALGECLDAEEVQVGTPNGPGIWIAPPNTEPPATTGDDYAAPWRCLGYLSDDGPTIGTSSDSTDLVPWQSAAPIKSIITSRSVTMQFSLWQLNAETLSIYFDTDIPTENPDGSLDMDVRTDQAGHTYAVSIDSRDGNRVLRITFLRASLTDAGDMPIQRGAVIPLDVTLSALETSGSLARIQLGPAVEGLAFAASANGTGGAAVAAAEERAGAPSQAGATVRPGQRGSVGGGTRRSGGGPGAEPAP